MTQDALAADGVGEVERQADEFIAAYKRYLKTVAAENLPPFSLRQAEDLIDLDMYGGETAFARWLIRHRLQSPAILNKQGEDLAGWRPIETAPECVPIDLWLKHLGNEQFRQDWGFPREYRVPDCQLDKQGIWWDGNSEQIYKEAILFWRPHPKPPTQEPTP